MSHKQRPRNPFDDEYDDKNDFVFVPKDKTESAETKHAYGDFGFEENNGESFDDDGGAVSIQSQIEQRQQNMLHSTKRSLGLVYESENIGNETAHELLRQGEQLQNIDKKLDKINKDIDESKRHVTSLRSVFGGVVNYFQGRKTQPETVDDQSKGPSRLRKLVGGSAGTKEEGSPDDHPAMRLRDPNAQSYNYKYDTSGFEGTSSSSITTTTHNSRMQGFDQQLDNNLDELSLGIGRLKDLGRGLGDEIDRQNDDIDRITGKTTNVDTRIESVNRDVTKILRR